MDEHGAFLSAIREAPDDDGSRLIYADWLDEHGETDKAEFIRLQCELARAPAGADAQSLRERERHLLLTHWNAWTAPLRGLIETGEFRRGLLEKVTIRAEVFLARADELFRLAPLREVRLRGVLACLPALANCPHLRRLDGLDLRGAFLDDNAVSRLASSPHLARLARLDLANNEIGNPGVAALATPKLGRLTALDLRLNRVGPDGVRGLVTGGKCPLEELHLGGNVVGDEGVAELIRGPLGRLRVLDLAFNRVGDRGLGSLLRSALLGGLETLDLRDDLVSGQEVRRLARAVVPPRLRRLDLRDNPVPDVAWDALDGSPWQGIVRAGRTGG